VEWIAGVRPFGQGIGMTLHCPWCGAGFVRDESGKLVCSASVMGLSRHLEFRFREVFGEQGRPSKPSSMDSMDKWYCAGCGVALVCDDDGIERCPACRHTMGEFAYELVEFHPHGPFAKNSY
jgi:hypothetical protein